MPKLNGTHLPERIASRLADLKAGKTVASKDIKALLSDEQIAVLDAACAVQTTLRKDKRVRSKEQKERLGWKSIREIHIEIYEQALIEAQKGMLDALHKLDRDNYIRQGKIYFESYGKAIDNAKLQQFAKNFANNNLTRAGLPRMDDETFGPQTKRDKKILKIEDELKEFFRSQMTPEELVQLELVEEHKKSLQKKAK